MKKIILLFAIFATNSFATWFKVSKIQRMPAKPLLEKIEKDTGTKNPDGPIILGEVTINVASYFKEYSVNIVKTSNGRFYTAGVPVKHAQSDISFYALNPNNPEFMIKNKKIDDPIAIDKLKELLKKVQTKKL